MGNICENCRKGGHDYQRVAPPAPPTPSSDKSLSSSIGLGESRRESNSVKLLNCVPIPLDDDWADEIWYDALENHQHPPNQDDDANHHEPVFEVTPDELQLLKHQLAQEFPADAEYMSDAYLLSVASKPYSKDMSVRRPLDYTMDKLMHVMEWRREMQASEMPKWIELCNNTNKCDDETVDSETWKRAQKMVESLNTGSMYWHGLTKEGRPILWIRTNRKFWYPNVQAEVDALIAMADVGIQFMPEGVTDFCCISHSYKPPPPNPKFAFQMLRGLVKGYPDRMHLLISAPVSSIVEFCMNLLLPLMPGRLAHKFSFYSLDHVQEKLESMLWNGLDDIPTFFGGPVEHDEYYPEEKYCPNRGKGTLKLDWYGMIERLKEQKECFERHRQQQLSNGHSHATNGLPEVTTETTQGETGIAEKVLV